MSDLANFFKSDTDRALCNDQYGNIWPIRANQTDLEAVCRRGVRMSHTLKQKNLAKFHLADEKRMISYEEYKEIH
jgi:hypothetical protein